MFNLTASRFDQHAAICMGQIAHQSRRALRSPDAKLLHTSAMLRDLSRMASAARESARLARVEGFHDHLDTLEDTTG